MRSRLRDLRLSITTLLMYPSIEFSRRPPQLLVRPGVMPDLWRRNVSYFGNTMGMFFGNDAQVGELQRRLGGVEFHGGRLVPVLDLMFHGEGRNVLYLERAPDPVLVQYFLDLELSIPRIEVLSREQYNDRDTMLGLLRGSENRWIDGYVTDQVLEDLAHRSWQETVGSYGACRVGNNKGVLHEFLADRGLPVFTNFYAGTQREVDSALDRLRIEGFDHALVKSVIGASGVGQKRVSTSRGGRDPVPESFFFEGACMVQGWISPGKGGVEEVLSPSVQIFLKDDSVTFYDITEQFLSVERSYKGNECPPAYLDWPEYAGVRMDLLEQAEIVGEWLHSLGLRGPASIDFLVVRTGGGSEVYVCEVNARVTGATYPSLLARHFQPGGAWVMRNLRFDHPMPTQDLLNVLSRHRYLFEVGMARGLMPYNLYTCEKGRVEQGQFLVMAPEIVTCKGLLIEAERDLPIDWEYEQA